MTVPDTEGSSALPGIRRTKGKLQEKQENTLKMYRMETALDVSAADVVQQG